MNQSTEGQRLLSRRTNCLNVSRLSDSLNTHPSIIKLESFSVMFIYFIIDQASNLWSPFFFLGDVIKLAWITEYREAVLNKNFSQIAPKWDLRLNASRATFLLGSGGYSSGTLPAGLWVLRESSLLLSYLSGGCTAAANMTGVGLLDRSQICYHKARETRPLLCLQKTSTGVICTGLALPVRQKRCLVSGGTMVCHDN